MAVELRAGSVVWPIGSADFFNAFFSTIAAHAQARRLGLAASPRDEDSSTRARSAARTRRAPLAELDQIREELRAHPPSDVAGTTRIVAKRPPWGDEIADTITDLGDYFVTADGRTSSTCSPGARLRGALGVPVVVE